MNMTAEQFDALREQVRREGHGNPEGRLTYLVGEHFRRSADPKLIQAAERTANLVRACGTAGQADDAERVLDALRSLRSVHVASRGNGDQGAFDVWNKVGEILS